MRRGAEYIPTIPASYQNPSMRISVWVRKTLKTRERARGQESRKMGIMRFLSKFRKREEKSLRERNIPSRAPSVAPHTYESASAAGVGRRNKIIKPKKVMPRFVTTERSASCSIRSTARNKELIVFRMPSNMKRMAAKGMMRSAASIFEIKGAIKRIRKTVRSIRKDLRRNIVEK